jgi:hypothetical protein
MEILLDSTAVYNNLSAVSILKGGGEGKIICNTLYIHIGKGPGMTNWWNFRSKTFRDMALGYIDINIGFTLQ